MPIQFTCSCGHTLEVADEYAGMEANCPVCAMPNRIPALGPTAISETGARSSRKPPPLPPPAPAEMIPIDETKPITTHAGLPIPVNLDFFVEAPKEIGILITAFSTLQKDKEPLSLSTRLAIVLGAMGSGGMLGILIAVVWTGINAGMALWMIGLGALGLFIGLLSTRFKHTCSYIGQHGVARFRCRGHRERIVREEVFLFREAIELRIGQTRHYYNGAYTGTQYAYTWSCAAKKKVFSLTGRHNSEPGTPKPTDSFWFAHAAEWAWSIHLLNNMEPLADDKGTYYFGLKKDNGVEVGSGYLTLFLGGEPVRLDRADIAQVQVSQGVFAIRRPDAKEGWFSSKGVYKFPYHDLGNAQFFLFVLERLVGVRAMA